jgi:hypothetical protein
MFVERWFDSQERSNIPLFFSAPKTVLPHIQTAI